MGFSSLLAKLGLGLQLVASQQWRRTTRRPRHFEAARIMSRPKSTRPKRSVVASFRLTPQERERIDQAAAVLGLGASGYARRAVLAAAAQDGSSVVTSRAAKTRLLALWTIQMGLVAEELRALRRQEAAGSIDPATVQGLSDRVYACHRAVLSMVEGPRA